MLMTISAKVMDSKRDGHSVAFLILFGGREH
jgi:hypothetical protein